MRTARVLTRLSTSRRRLSGARSLSSSGVLPSHALSSSSFPTVDVGGLLPEAASDRRAAAHESLRAALVGDDAPGFFYALDAPDALSRAYLDDVYDFVSRAHDLPAGVKSKFADPELGSGELGCAYNGPDVGHLEPSYDGVSTATASAWDYSPHGAARAGGGWDAALPCDFAATFEDLYARQNAVGRAVLVGVAEVLGLPPDTFARSFDEGDLGTIRLISYPGYDEPVHTFTTANANSGDHSWTYYDEDTLHPADVGIAPHTDFEAFTLMHQDAPGLQLLTRGELDKGADADWIDAPVADAFVVIVGDVLERYTNGVLRATPHRVVRRANARRSIIRFNAVAPDELVAPLPAFGEPRYTPVTMRNHMDTTLRNLRQGIPSWDAEANTSRSATYVYE